jgi:hypothetical protein
MSRRKEKMMQKELLAQIKKTMKQYGAKHAIYGIVKWNGETEIVEDAYNANYHATDFSFEDEVKYLVNVRGAKMVYAIHSQN